MKIELIKWESEGLRSPDVVVDLIAGDGDGRQVSLIQMPNGTGKTTTLTCLRAAMDGSAESWEAPRVMEFRRKDGPDEGRFLAHLRVNDSQKVIFELNFNFEHGVVTYQTAAGSKNQSGYCPPPEVRRYLDPRFSELLIFDGELAADLITGAKGTNASQVIDTFYGLYHLKEMRKEAEDAYKSLVQSAKSKVGSAEIQRATSKIRNLEDRYDELEDKCRDGNEELIKLKNLVSRLDNEIEERLLQSEKFQKQESEARDRRSEAESDLQQALHDLDAQFPNPLVLFPELGSELGEMVDNLDKLKLPEGTSRSFFEELICEPKCVCDRVMDEGAKKSIKNRAKLILGDSINGYLNELKRSVKRTCNDLSSPDLEELIQGLTDSDDRLADAQSQLEDIREMAAQAGDDEVRRKREELSQAKDRIGELATELEEMQRPTMTGDGEGGKCIDYFRKRIADLKNKLAHMTATVQAKEKMDTLGAILDESYRKAYQDLKSDVIFTANEQLLEILKFNPVQIKDVEGRIILDSQTGASVGQSLSVGYVFLAGVLHGGGNQFPLVVDSPVGSLDNAAREELGKLLPQLVKQLVAFVIPTERQWFIEPICDAAEGDVRFLTHLRKNDHTEGIIPKLGGMAVCDTETGVLIDGEDAFLALGADVKGTED